jgi:HAD superfamily hydrolase (TIGR01450 family)
VTTQTWPPRADGAWVVDLDGVVWLAGEAIVGSAAAVARLREAGARVLFATNNSALTVATIIERLARIAIPATPEDIATSSRALASLLEPGTRVLALAERGVTEALASRGVTIVEEGPADAVAVGWTREFDFDRLARAAETVRAGARLYGTNDDGTFPTPSGLLPGAGALLAAVATASGVAPIVAGKPNEPMVQLVRQMTGHPVAVVGDRPATDGVFAERLGVSFGLVLSGVTPAAAVGPLDGSAGPEGDATPAAGGAAAVAATFGDLVDDVLRRR